MIQNSQIQNHIEHPNSLWTNISRIDFQTFHYSTAQFWNKRIKNIFCPPAGTIPTKKICGKDFSSSQFCHFETVVSIPGTYVQYRQTIYNWKDFAQPFVMPGGVIQTDRNARKSVIIANGHVLYRSLKRKGNAKGIQTIATFPADNILNLVNEYSPPNYFKIGNEVFFFKMHKDKYICFKNSKICACCGLIGKIMALQIHPDQKDIAHFSLYAFNRKKKSVLMTIDHIKPISKGGTHTIDNYQVLCYNCNQIKNDQYLTLEELKKYIKKH